MRLCTVSAKDLEPFFGIEIKQKILRISVASKAAGLRPAQRAVLADMMSYLQHWPRSEKLLRGLLERITESPDAIAGEAEDGYPFLIPKKSVVYLPPVPAPSKILCIGLNYRDHCEEQNKKIPEFPIVFNKFRTSLVGADQELKLPLDVDQQLDYEAEFAFIIGKRATKVTKRAAMKHVACFTIMNDVSARSLQYTEKQWARAKGFDNSGPCGPCLVTADEVGDPHALDIKCRLNGKIMQNSNTKNLVFKIPDLIRHISAMITLEPGDIISTGTPGGVGIFREPQVFLRDGDEVSIEIEGLGRLTNQCVAR